MKLKKLGKYFTKGLQAGVLASALIAGTASCSQPAGGNTYTPNNTTIGGGEQGGTTTPPVDPTKPTEPTTPTTPTKPGDENEQKYPDYYIDEEFGGQRFVEENANSGSITNTTFITHYNQAKEFMGEKFTEVREALGTQTAPYAKTLLDALSTYNSATKITGNAGDMNTNYRALAPFFATLENPYIQAEDGPSFYTIKASYHKLAQSAFNKSIGSWTIDPCAFETNTEMGEDGFTPSGTVKEELKAIGYNSFKELTVLQAKDNMKRYLNLMADRTNIRSDILYKVLELALYNESLYGLNDMAKECGVQQVNNTPRTLNTFNTLINDVRSQYTSLNIDDGRTM